MGGPVNDDWEAGYRSPAKVEDIIRALQDADEITDYLDGLPDDVMEAMREL